MRTAVYPCSWAPWCRHYVSAPVSAAHTSSELHASEPALAMAMPTVTASDAVPHGTGTPACRCLIDCLHRWLGSSDGAGSCPLWAPYTWSYVHTYLFMSMRGGGMPHVAIPGCVRSGETAARTTPVPIV
jgi:hypothetical protein